MPDRIRTPHIITFCPSFISKRIKFRNSSKTASIISGYNISAIKSLINIMTISYTHPPIAYFFCPFLTSIRIKFKNECFRSGQSRHSSNNNITIIRIAIAIVISLPDTPVYIFTCRSIIICFSPHLSSGRIKSGYNKLYAKRTFIRICITNSNIPSVKSLLNITNCFRTIFAVCFRPSFHYHTRINSNNFFIRTITTITIISS